MRQTPPLSISAVFPAYNDAGTIASVAIAALRALSQVSADYEIIITNDGSADHTAEILQGLQSLYPALKIIQHPRNRGYGGALRSGFSAATKEWVFYTDGDAQYNPLELPKLTQALQPGIDVVNGYKIKRKDSPLRWAAGRLYHHTMRLLFGFRLRDVDCDFRLIRRSALQQISLQSDSGAICVEMVKKLQDAGFTFAEAPVNHYPRPYGISQFFQPHHLWQTLKQIVPLWWKLAIRKEHLR